MLSSTAMDPLPLLALILAAATVAYLVWRGGLFSRRRCRWRHDGFRPRDARLQRWTCARCGVEAFSATGKPPRDCKRAYRPTGP